LEALLFKKKEKREKNLENHYLWTINILFTEIVILPIVLCISLVTYLPFIHSAFGAQESKGKTDFLNIINCY